MRDLALDLRSTRVRVHVRADSAATVLRRTGACARPGDARIATMTGGARTRRGPWCCTVAGSRRGVWPCARSCRCVRPSSSPAPVLLPTTRPAIDENPRGASRPGHGALSLNWRRSVRLFTACPTRAAGQSSRVATYQTPLLRGGLRDAIAGMRNDVRAGSFRASLVVLFPGTPLAMGPIEIACRRRRTSLGRRRQPCQSAVRLLTGRIR